MSSRKFLLIGILLLAASGTFGQEGSARIGEIEFYGYSGIDLAQIRAALPYKEGDEFTFETLPEKLAEARRAIKRVIGHEPMEIAPTCCDDQRRWIFFTGLSGKSFSYNPAPHGAAQLPPEIVDLYQRFMDAVLESTQKGMATEDRSQGFALAAYPPLRDAQLKMREYALAHDRLLIKVLDSSAEDKERIVAAEVLGFARQSTRQILALVRASRDSNETVRNNATRALIVLTKGPHPEIVKLIPADGFIEMLLSGTWTDLNKGSALVEALAQGRDRKLFARLRQPEVMQRLIEMARWRTGHADAARYIIGRLAGIEERRLQQLIAAGDVDAIIKADETKSIH